MLGLIISNRQPIMHKLSAKQAPKSHGYIERQVNGIELDMGQGVEKGEAPLSARRDFPLGHLGRGNKLRPGLPTWGVWNLRDISQILARV